MDTDNLEILITWCDAVTGITETRPATPEEIKELMDAGYGQNVVAP